MSRRLPFVSDEEPSTQRSPEHRLLMSILGRALCDLHPKVNHIIRRDAIIWFREKTLAPENDVTSFSFIKSELSLGQHMLNLIDQALDEALEFEDYCILTIRNKGVPSAKEWTINKRVLILNKRGTFTPNVRYQRKLLLLDTDT